VITILEYFLLVLTIAYAAGFIGALVGMGGGVIISPVLTLLFGVPVAIAAGASLLAVIGTSSGAGFTAYGKNTPANYRIGLLLMTVSTVGAILGAVTTIFLSKSIRSEWIIYIIFGVAMMACAAALFRSKTEEDADQAIKDPLATKLNLHSSYYEESTKKRITYYPRNIPFGMGLNFVAGILGGMFGIGGGAFNNISMNGIMKFPMKVSAATSNLINGVTAASSFGVYYLTGNVYPLIAVPAVIGIILGSISGRRVLSKAKTPVVRFVFIAILVAIGVEMIMKGVA
jgi:uncharacterized membrane protein YfcA